MFLVSIYTSLYSAVVFEGAPTEVSPRNKYTANIQYYF